MKVFILDNYDSFTYNLLHIIEQYAEEVCVRRNDEIDLNHLKSFHKIVFSPGPGLPSEVKIMGQIIKNFKETKAILGVCLGHQAIAEFFGASLINMPEVNHGREFNTKVIKPDYLFNEIPDSFHSGRYHSWIVSKNNFPTSLEITSIDDKEQIMSLRHKKFDIRGVQFHPESVMTAYGEKILENWIRR